ncbi:LysR family transcriptional regulator [Erwinia aphidicola]|uniref:LysR family transcriptional regulator n=1 Tax=Erwinia aphidicola TaxID=68334 RepID=UPI00300C6D66
MYNHFQDMVLFASLVEEGSFTKLADKLGLPKSRVSQRINNLEEHVGVRLLNRSTRRVSMTSAGETYLQFCHEIIQTAEKAEEFSQLVRERPSGRLRVIAPPGLMYALLSAWHLSFMEKHPHIALDIHTAHSFYDSVEGAFDVAFRIGKPVEQSYIGRFLGKIKRVLVASPKYHSVNEITLPQKLMEIDLIVHKTWKKLALTSEKNRFEEVMSSKHTSDNLMYILQCALNGSGVAILPEYLASTYLAAGQLDTVLPDWQVEDDELWMIYPSNKNNSMTLKLYVEFIMDSFKKTI